MYIFKGSSIIKLSTPDVPLFTNSEKWNKPSKIIQILVHDWRMEHLPVIAVLFCIIARYFNDNSGAS